MTLNDLEWLSKISTTWSWASCLPQQCQLWPKCSTAWPRKHSHLFQKCYDNSHNHATVNKVMRPKTTSQRYPGSKVRNKVVGQCLCAFCVIYNLFTSSCDGVNLQSYITWWIVVTMTIVNPLMGTANYSAISNNMKLVHWPLVGGQLHLVQQRDTWAGSGPAQAPPRCTKCNSPPINGQCTNHCIALQWSVALWC